LQSRASVSTTCAAKFRDRVTTLGHIYPVEHYRRENIIAMIARDIARTSLARVFRTRLEGKSISAQIIKLVRSIVAPADDKGGP